MSRLRIFSADKPLSGSVPVPSDKSIGHRALIFGALAHGTSRIQGFSYGEDNVATLNAFRAMGVSFDDDSRGTVLCHGVGLNGLDAPAKPIDCGNSGTTMRLLSGLLAAQPFASTLIGDASLSRRPMARIAKPLNARGANITGQAHPSKPDDITAPLHIAGLTKGERLEPMEYEMTIPSAQVKSALLLSGLYASGPTAISEPLVSRDHTERMMEALRLPVDTVGTLVQLHPPADPECIEAFEIQVPGDISAAAFILAAGLLVEGSTVSTRDTGLNPTRTGFLDIIKQFYGSLRIQPQGSALGEGFGVVSTGFGQLKATGIGGEIATRAIDEIPIACALAARANGTTRFCDVGELRVKESDRIAEMVKVLRAFGVHAEETEDGLLVEGQPEGQLKAAVVQSEGDHRIAMTAAVLGLVARGETIVEDADCIGTSFPRFVGTLRALGAHIEVES